MYEERLQNMIYKKFLGRLPEEEEQEKISLIDNTMLYFEFEKIMDYKIFDGDFELYAPLDTAFYGFEDTEKEFLSLFCMLYCLSEG